MSVQLITEEQARALAPADSIFVRRYNSVFAYFMFLFVVALGVIGLGWPWLQTYIANATKDVPLIVSAGGGLVLLVIAAIAANDMRYNLRPSSWLLLIAADRLYLNCHQYNKPVDTHEKTVLQLERRQLAGAEPYKGVHWQKRGNKTQIQTYAFIDLVLHEPLSPEIMQLIEAQQQTALDKWLGKAAANPVFKNKLQMNANFSSHRSVMADSSAKRLRLMIRQITPSFSKITAALQPLTPVAPLANLKAAPEIAGTWL